MMELLTVYDTADTAVQRLFSFEIRSRGPLEITHHQDMYVHPI